MSGGTIFVLGVFCVGVGYLLKCMQEAIPVLLRNKSDRNEMDVAVKKIANTFVEIIEKIEKAK